MMDISAIAIGPKELILAGYQAMFVHTSTPCDFTSLSPVFGRLMDVRRRNKELRLSMGSPPIATVSMAWSYR